MESKMRPRLAYNANYRCCFCFHVRTGATIIGIWHLVLNVMAFVLLYSVFLYPEVKEKLSNWTGIAPRSVSPSLAPDVERDTSNLPQLPDLNVGPASSTTFVKEACIQDIPVALVITLCTFGITVVYLYGTLKGSPNCLMPFFCLQIFDFVVSTLTVVAYFTFLPNVRGWIEQYKDFPLQKQLLSLDAQWLCAIVMVTIITTMLIKAYLMGIVWSCYKYLKMEQMAHLVESYAEVDGEVPALLAPDYDMIAKMPPPPPPYYPSQ